MRIGLAGAGRIGAFHASILARLPGVGSVIVADVDGNIQQPGLNCPVRQQLRRGQKLLARAVSVLHGADEVEALPATHIDESHK